MQRSFRQFLDSRRVLPPVLVVVFILSMLPLRWLGWLGVFGTLTQTLVAPIMNTGAALSQAVRPPVAREASSKDIERLTSERDHAMFMLTQVQQENERLRGTIKDLQRGAELAPDLSLKLVAASVIGRDADLTRQVLQVRAGSAQGVVPGSIAVVEGAQLLGRVSAVGPRVSTVVLVTDKAAGRVRGLVMVDGVPEPGGVECDLEPASGGVLRGRLGAPELAAGGSAPEVKIGQVVRLSDLTWPRNAQMLELGTVESIKPNPEQPIRQIITVRPRFDLSRASEVLLRIAGETESGGGPP